MKNISTDRWMEIGLVVFGAIGTIIGVGTWFGARFEILLAFVAGAGWAIVVPLLIILRRERLIIESMLSEIQEQKSASAEIRSILAKDSDSLNTIIMRSIQTVRPRARAVPAASEVATSDIREASNK